MSLVKDVISWKPEKTPQLEEALGKLSEHVFKIKGKYYSPHLVVERKENGIIVIYPAKGHDLPQEITPPIGAVPIAWKKTGIEFSYLGINYEILSKKPEQKNPIPTQL